MANGLPRPGSCNECIYWNKIIANATDSECRRYPPQIVYTAMADVKTAFPKTYQYNWCGEFVKL